MGPRPPADPAHPLASQGARDAAPGCEQGGGAAWAAGSRGWGETCGHVASMAPACQILHWALALGLSLAFGHTRLPVSR